MARSFHRKRSLAPMAELNVTNMIDLGFSLLIVFMITTPLMKQEQSIPLNLPVESARPQVKKEDVFQDVSIDREGRYYLGTQHMSLAELSMRLGALAASPRPPVISIRADFSLQYQQVVRLLDEIKRHNLTRISLDTRTAD